MRTLFCVPFFPVSLPFSVSPNWLQIALPAKAFFELDFQKKSVGHRGMLSNSKKASFDIISHLNLLEEVTLKLKPEG